MRTVGRVLCINRFGLCTCRITRCVWSDWFTGRVSVENEEREVGVMVRWRRVLLGIALGFLTLSGCGGPKWYGWGGVKYGDAQQALAAHRSSIDDWLLQVHPLDKPLRNRGLIILPDRTQIWTYNITGAKKSMSEAAKEYLLASTEMDYDYQAEALAKRRIFTTLEIERSGNPEDLLKGNYDVILYKSANLKQWLMKRRNRVEAEPVFFDQSTKVVAERVASWLEYIEKQLSE
jgi:hypothetical protein